MVFDVFHLWCLWSSILNNEGYLFNLCREKKRRATMEKSSTEFTFMCMEGVDLWNFQRFGWPWKICSLTLRGSLRLYFGHFIGPCLFFSFLFFSFLCQVLLCVDSLCQSNTSLWDIFSNFFFYLSKKKPSG